MRYVLVCIIKGEAAKLNEKLAFEVKSKFNARRSKLPPHFTIKAPFETSEENIYELKEVLEKFRCRFNAEKMSIDGFSSFRKDVVYMKVNLSRKGKEVHDQLIDELKRLKWLQWKNNEGKDKVFHCTIVSKKVKEHFDEILTHVKNYECNYKCYFDNISLYKWNVNKWEIDKEYNLTKVEE
ncbi:2'-5' RNA ligase family protein [Clostridium felsineum]|uniref:2'-5' RNA ligase family protein n=1 Tax=Clostridium felsineum TaxID=36839 RepID=UPI00214DE357|nr:2'-5' RNA ligase family protein [Clostridium felsineum]MCR3760614.1 2'-5' RNA ligase family protein [Clostridium felsineum]